MLAPVSTFDVGQRGGVEGNLDGGGGLVDCVN